MQDVGEIFTSCNWDKENLIFSIKIYTSIRPHAKFGDFISTIIPLFWVTNILINSNYRKYLSKYFRTTLQVFGKYARSVDVEYPFSTLAYSVGRVTQGGVIPWLSNAKLIQTPTQSDSRRNCVTTSQYQHASDQ